MSLNEFLAAYDKDDNEWWRLDMGDQLNLFNEAIERMQTAERTRAEILQGSRTWRELALRRVPPHD